MYLLDTLSAEYYQPSSHRSHVTVANARSHAAHTMREMALYTLLQLRASCRIQCCAQQEHVNSLCDWITASGGSLSAVRVAEVDGMRGVVLASKPSLLSMELFRVPSALAMSDVAEEMLETPIGAAIGRTGLALLQPDARLALRLLHEGSRGSCSPWADYIAILPRHVGCARHLSDDCLLACGSDFVVQQALRARKYAGSVRASLARLVGEEASGRALMSELDEERLGWALDMVHSRSFSVDIGTRGVARLMVPFLDLLNSNPTAPTCSFTYDDTDVPPSFAVDLLAPAVERPLPAVGTEQVFLDYGPQTSEELLLMYGFVPPVPTPCDSITLLGAYAPEDLAAAMAAAEETEGSVAAALLQQEKLALLASCRYGPPRQFELASRRLNPAIICALRLALLTRQELDGECGGSWNRPLAHAPVCLANERRVALALLARLERMLERESTTLEHDRALLAGRAGDEGVDDEDGMLDDLRPAIMLRANRKQVITECTARLGQFVAATDAGEATSDNLLDYFEDYMPSIRLT